MTETLLDMFKNLPDDEKDEFIQLIIKEINKKCCNTLLNDRNGIKNEK